MNNKNFDEFTQLLVAVGELYGKPVSAQVFPIWWSALEKFDFPAVRDAFSRHAVNPDNGQFMPKPADIIRMLQGTSLDSSMAAWAKVDKAVRQVGTYASVVFDDPLIHRVIADMGGWVQLGTKTDDEWPFIQRDFINLYKGYSHRGERPEYDPVLVGIADAQNRPQGFAMTEPKLIGAPEKARLVLQGGTSTRLNVVSLADVAAKRIAAT